MSFMTGLQLHFITGYQIEHFSSLFLNFVLFTKSKKKYIHVLNTVFPTCLNIKSVLPKRKMSK